MPFATAKEGELAAVALGVADATHGAHSEPEDSMPERELLELPTSATARVEAPRHQVRSEKPNEPKRCSARLHALGHGSCPANRPEQRFGPHGAVCAPR